MWLFYRLVDYLGVKEDIENLCLLPTILTCLGYCYWFRIGRLLVGNTKNRFLVSFGNWPSLSCWTLNHMCNRVTCPWVLNMTRRLISFLLMRYKASTSLVLYLCFLVKSWCWCLMVGYLFFQPCNFICVCIRDGFLCL